jgi:hypothetical protein
MYLSSLVLNEYFVFAWPTVAVILMWFCLNLASGIADLQHAMAKFSQATS